MRRRKFLSSVLGWIGDGLARRRHARFPRSNEKWKCHSLMRVNRAAISKWFFAASLTALSMPHGHARVTCGESHALSSAACR
jgi:hypothetical protein